jgi:predicted dehydrogenase
VATDAAFQRSLSGGGVLLDKGAHALDTLVQVFGHLRVKRAWDDALVGGVESNAMVELSGPKADGSLQLSWDQSLNNGFEISGSHGAVAVDLGNIHSYRIRQPGGAWRFVTPPVAWADDVSATPTRLAQPRGYHDCFRLGWIAFVRAVLYGEPPVASGQDGVSVMEIIHDAYACVRPMDMAWLDDNERAAQAARHWKAEP